MSKIATGIKLAPKTVQGRRRIALMADVAKLEPFTMDAFVSHTEREDVRWMWRNDIVKIVAKEPLRFKFTDIGRAALIKGEADIKALDEEDQAA